ncbi:tetratricopeptide repeat protein [Ancylomarina subtilis]|uniref:Tetratricopeptide repeat protein n=1 Tax=Ancylomarina subtilis TaxID=1639035 RepID=A0A4V2FRS2_9BACT|nr:tetratricopeptide repeat protein [Ancylomarina subtilis]RZT91359.1 tetratricopeptide repeat protein [Ancylomarina subtilis]
MRILLTFLLVFSSVYSYSGNVTFIDEGKVDSLENRLAIVDDDQKLELLLKICQELVEKDSEKCIAYAEEALRLSQKLSRPQSQVKALIFLGREDSNLGNYFEGLQHFKEAAGIAESENDGRGLVDSWNEIGITYFKMSNYEDAQTFYFKALKKAEEIDYKNRVKGLKNNIAIIYSIYKDHDKALELFNKLLEIYEKEKDFFHFALTSVNIANIYDEIGEYEKGFQYLDRAIPIFTESGNNLMLTSTLNNRGVIYLKLNKKNEALADYQRALEISEENNYESGIISSSINIGEYWANENKLEKALAFFEKALKIALEDLNKASIKDCYAGIAKVYTLQGNYQKALEKTKQFMAYRDEIYNERTQKQINELQIKYETEKKEEEIELLQLKMRIQKRNQIILIVGLLIISFLILRVLHLKQLNLKRKNLLLEQVSLMDKLALEKMDSEKREKDLENLRLQEEILAKEEINRLKQLKFREDLKHKERELAANALHVVSKNETLDSLKKSVEAVLASDKNDIQASLKRLIQEIESNINLDQDWDIFKMHFEEVHQGFFKRLIEKYTDLNTNDLRFCAYLRLNLDAKEIARILNLSVNAIEKRRYRLRKKLGLESSDNLFEFLSNF